MGEKLQKTVRDGVIGVPSDGDPLRYEVTCEPGDFTFTAPSPFPLTREGLRTSTSAEHLLDPEAVALVWVSTSLDAMCDRLNEGIPKLTPAQSEAARDNLAALMRAHGIPADGLAYNG